MGLQVSGRAATFVLSHGFPWPRRLDKDGDGIVTKQEAQEGLRETDISPEMLQRRDLGDLGPTAATKWLRILDSLSI